MQDLQAIFDEKRVFWQQVAKRFNWDNQNVYVQVWLNPDGTVEDSVSHRGLTGDIAIDARTEAVIYPIPTQEKDR